MSILNRWKKKERKDWESDLDESKKTLYGITINIVMFSIVELIIGLFFVNKYIKFILGIILGTIVAIMLVRNMYSVIDKAVVENQEVAEGIVRRGSLIRSLCVFIIFIVVVQMYECINVFAMIISMLNLKFAAYLTPFTNKYLFTR